MNHLTIIGNLTADPELRTTPQGISVCSFTVAVNGRKKDDTTYFRVSAWRGLGENCAKYLAKGRKAAITGTVSARAYTTNGGEARASLEVNADEVEFLSPAGEQGYQPQQSAPAMQPVVAEDLPF